MPLHIVMLGTSLNAPGGMTSVVLTLRAGGLFQAAQVTYLASYEGKGLFRQLRVFSAALVRLLNTMLRRNVGLVHVHSASRGSFWRKSIACVCARAFGIPYVFQIHSGEFPTFYHHECGNVAKWWIRNTLNNASVVICLTEYWQRQIATIATNARTSVIGNPVEVPPTLRNARDSVRNVLFLGRLRQKKGVFDLVQSIPIVDRPNVKFILAGDEDADGVMAMAKDLGIAGQVDLPGWVDGEKKNTVIAEADMFVLPSYFEGFPVGILEAMANGIPIVTTPVGGIADVVVDRQHALLVPPGDVAALADAIRTLVDNQEMRIALRVAAYHRVAENYSVPVIVSRYLALYSSVMKIKSGVVN
jgi:glycosyltransferase involved in cell wall biosynthesis